MTPQQQRHAAKLIEEEKAYSTNIVKAFVAAETKELAVYKPPTLEKVVEKTVKASTSLFIQLSKLVQLQKDLPAETLTEAFEAFKLQYSLKQIHELITNLLNINPNE